MHDITVVSPAFHQHHLIGFFACTAHVVDIGGRGFGADAASIYEEGLRIPIMKFAESGQVDTTLVALIKSNVREPEQVVGDIYALASCNEIGQRRLLEMMQEYGIQDLCAIAEFILENSHRATVEKLAALPQRQAEGVMRIDGYDAPIDLCVSVTVNQDHIKCDFTGMVITPEGKAVAFMPSNVGLAPAPPELKVSTSARRASADAC